MALTSWFNSSTQVEAVLICVAIVGAFVEFAVAIAAVINVHKEIGKAKKKRLEKYIEIFACVAAVFFVAEAILGWRTSVSLERELKESRARLINLNLELKDTRENI